MMAFDELRIVFISPPKTGSRAVLSVLREQEQGRCVPPDCSRHSFVSRSEVGRVRDYLWAASVRNPFIRIVSLFYHEQQIHHAPEIHRSFREAIHETDRLPESIYGILFRENGSILTYLEDVDVLVRKEFLQEDVRTKLCRESLASVELPWHDQPGGEYNKLEWWLEYDREAVRVALSLFGNEIKYLRRFYDTDFLADVPPEIRSTVFDSVE